MGNELVQRKLPHFIKAVTKHVHVKCEGIQLERMLRRYVLDLMCRMDHIIKKLPYHFKISFLDEAVVRRVNQPT